MLRQVTAAILLITFFAQTFNSMLIVADYYVNTAAFEKYCENKTKPNLHCNGKCQMLKTLKEEQKKEDSLPDRKIENKNETAIFLNTSLTEFTAVAVKIDHNFSPFDEDGLTGMPRSLFHPPQV